MKNTALLLVDIQDSFLVGGRWARRGNPAFEENVTLLLDAWRDAGLPLFFILHTDPDPGFRQSDPEFRLMDFLRRRDDEPVIVKTTFNSFTSTDLEARLDALGIERVVVTGISLEQCVETTTRVAKDLGYEVDFVIDATQTFPIVDKRTGEELPVSALYERAQYVLRDRFARIVTAREVVEELSVPA
ncbi:MAG TPA: isochorismatase family protein [Thermoanaerobaculia bacterium]|nr:isochorismatase family protein [Thermoanaerobaculia bacterium]